MKQCEHKTTRVVDSERSRVKPLRKYGRLRRPPCGCICVRRRECATCGQRFTTYELSAEQLAKALAFENAFLAEEKKKIWAIKDIIDSIQMQRDEEENG